MILLTLLALPVLGATGYLFALTVLSRVPAPPPPGPGKRRFLFVVPAHDEAPGIAATVKNLLAVAYPEALRRVQVVADNCADETAAVAQAAGARVLARNDPERRGKGYALAAAFERAKEEGWAEAVVVVDADSRVSPNLLTSFDARLALGARAVQADYAVLEAGRAWRTRLMAIAFALFHAVRSLGRERLRLSCGLRGNGMCFETALLADVPHSAYSVVEDVEYGLRLGEAGIRVWYAFDAHVWGEMVSSEKASRSQRQRWEGGRWALARRRAPALFAQAARRRSALLFDLALDLTVPPLSWLGLSAGLGLTVSAWASVRAGHVAPAAWAFGGAVALLAAHTLRGWQLSGTGARGLLDLFCVPLYVGWKLSLPLRRRAQPKSAWVRTTRRGEGA